MELDFQFLILRYYVSVTLKDPALTEWEQITEFSFKKGSHRYQFLAVEQLKRTVKEVGQGILIPWTGYSWNAFVTLHHSHPSFTISQHKPALNKKSPCKNVTLLRLWKQQGRALAGSVLIRNKNKLNYQIKSNINKIVNRKGELCSQILEGLDESICSTLLYLEGIAHPSAAPPSKSTYSCPSRAALLWYPGDERLRVLLPAPHFAFTPGFGC